MLFFFHSIRCCLPLSNSNYGCYLLYTFANSVFFRMRVFLSCMKLVLHNHNHRPLWGICIIIPFQLQFEFIIQWPILASIHWSCFFALFLHWNLSNGWSDRVENRTTHNDLYSSHKQRDKLISYTRDFIKMKQILVLRYKVALFLKNCFFSPWATS